MHANPLKKVTPRGDGGHEYHYQVGGVAITLPVPPPGFDAATAPQSEREAYGVPSEPPSNEVSAHALWEEMVHNYHVVKPPPNIYTIGEAQPAFNATGESSNWSGYVDEGTKGKYNATGMIYTEPPSVPTYCWGAAASFWTGLGGYETTPLDQAGTQIGHGFTVAEHQAWFEIWPQEAEMAVNLYATPGYKFEVTLSHESGNEVEGLAYNFHTGESVPLRGVSSESYSGASAEYIAERPGVSSGLTPLADFSQLDVAEAWANGNHTWGPWEFPYVQLNMTNESTLLAQTSLLYSQESGQEFSVGWKAYNHESGSSCPNAQPSVGTESASNIEAPYATLRGNVNPNDLKTSYHFQYGTTTNWNESSTSWTEAGSGRGSIKESAAIGGLLPYTTYYFRVIAENADGTSVGSTENFTTGAPRNGSVWRVYNGHNAGEILTAAGGALIPVTECAGEVVCTGYTEFSSEFAAQYQGAHSAMTNSTVVRVGDGKNAGEISTVAGGVPVTTWECAGEVSCSGYVNVDSKGLKSYEEAHSRMTNSTVVRVGDGKNAGEILTVAGGVPITVNECAGEVSCSGYVNVDSKGLKSYEEAHSRMTNSTVVRVGDGKNAGEILTVAGGVPITVNECAGEVSCSGYVNVDSKGLKSYEEAHSAMTNSTVVRVGDGKNAGEILTVAGGVPIMSWECAGEVSCSGYVNVDSKGLKSYEEAHSAMTNSTVVRVGDGKNAGEISISAGGALLAVNECTLLNGCSGYVNVDSKGLKSYEEAHPTIANGTYLLGLPSKKIWIIEGGKREETGSHEGSVTVTDVMLEKIPKS